MPHGSRPPIALRCLGHRHRWRSGPNGRKEAQTQRAASDDYRLGVTSVCGTLLCAPAGAQTEEPPDKRPAPPTEATDAQQGPPTLTDDEWLDRTQRGVYDLAMNSAMRIDHMFGSDRDLGAYRGAQGSLSPAVLWDEFDGFQPKLRFHVDLPLPQLNERFGAFIGRVNRDEYVTERSQQSGAFQRQYGPASEEQTLAGIVYRTPRKQGSRFDAGAGVRLRFPLDPYVKGSYVYERGNTEQGLMSLRQTVFWQNSEHAGVTTRGDIERVLRDRLAPALDDIRHPSRRSRKACTATPRSRRCWACPIAARSALEVGHGR